MGRFFRHIRQTLFLEGRVSRYLGYATGEIVLIVVGILIALQISNWNEERLELKYEQRYLASLKLEFDEALRMLTNFQKLLEVMLEAHESLIGQIQGETLFQWLSRTSRPLGFKPPRAVLDELVSSGGTLLIRSVELRTMLAKYDFQLEEMDKTSAEAWEVWVQQIQPFLQGKVPRVDRLRLVDVGYVLNEQGVAFPFAPSPFKADFDDVLSRPEFEDMLAERWLRVWTSKQAAENLKATMEESIRLIVG